MEPVFCRYKEHVKHLLHVKKKARGAGVGEELSSEGKHDDGKHPDSESRAGANRDLGERSSDEVAPDTPRAGIGEKGLRGRKQIENTALNQRKPVRNMAYSALKRVPINTENTGTDDQVPEQAPKDDKQKRDSAEETPKAIPARNKAEKKANGKRDQGASEGASGPTLDDDAKTANLVD